MRAPTVAQPWYRRVARRALIALLVIAALGNVAWLLAYRHASTEELLQPQPESGQEVTLAIDAGKDGILAANEANTLLLFQHGTLAHHVQVNAYIGGIAASPDGMTIYAGTYTGEVLTFSPTLTKERSFIVNGRVVGLTVTATGGLLVAYGEGPYSNLYYVSYYPKGTAHPAYTTQVGFTITALTVLHGDAIYGLLNAQAGAIDTAGKILWQGMLNNPVTQLLAVPQNGQIVVGDQHGGLSLLNSHGSIHKTLSLSQYPIHALAFDPTIGTYFAADANGEMFVLDQNGKQILSRTISSGNDIVALIPLGDERVLAVPSAGHWVEVNASAISGANQASQVSENWQTFDIVLLLAILATLVVVVDRLRRVAVAAWRGRLAYLFLLPAIGFIGLFTYYPAGMAVYYSFTNFSLRNVTQFVGLTNYWQILTSDFYFRTGLLNMLILTVAGVIKTMTVPLLVAELIFWLRNHVHQYIFRTLFVLPAIVPGLVFTLLWRQVYDPRTGLLNELLGAVGLSRLQQAWLGEASTALWAIVAVGFPYVDAFSFLILLGGLLNINAEFFDAAKVDGASGWARFRHLDLPLLVGQFRILLFFAVAGTVQGFASIFILTQGGPGYATYVPALQMYLQISYGNFGYASAIGVILFVIIFVATLFILRFRRGDALETA